MKNIVFSVPSSLQIKYTLKTKPYFGLCKALCSRTSMELNFIFQADGHSFCFINHYMLHSYKNLRKAANWHREKNDMGINRVLRIPLL